MKIQIPDGGKHQCSTFRFVNFLKGEKYWAFGICIVGHNTSSRKTEYTCNKIYALHQDVSNYSFKGLKAEMSITSG